jgi:DNA-binding SARP family transcriptional activator
MLNEKQEKFAQSYVLHNNATEAAKSAGYSAASAANQGYRLLQIDEIVERVDVIDELESQYAFAKSNGHTNSAIKALELLSRVRGANSDVNPNLDSETLEGAIIGCLNILGEDVVLGMLSKCDFADSIFSDEDLENMALESMVESVTEGAVDPTYPEEVESTVT